MAEYLYADCRLDSSLYSIICINAVRVSGAPWTVHMTVPRLGPGTGRSPFTCPDLSDQKTKVEGNFCGFSLARLVLLAVAPWKETERTVPPFCLWSSGPSKIDVCHPIPEWPPGSLYIYIGQCLWSLSWLHAGTGLHLLCCRRVSPKDTEEEL